MNVNNERHDKMAAQIDKEIKNYTTENDGYTTRRSFMDALEDERVQTSYAYTDNGALVYETSGSNLVDFNLNISAMRSKSEDEIASDFRQAFLDNKELAVRYLFFAGDIREGLGERHVFNSIMKNLAQNEPEIAKAVLEFIPEYGRWDEVVNLLNTPIRKDVVKLISTQLSKDIDAASKDEPVSLCAKWMPSLQASNSTVRKNALILCDELGMKKSDYRHMLSDLRNRLNIIEKALAEKDVEKLDAMQESLSSKQNYKYKDALMRLMPEQRTEYFNKVLRGEANYNADVLEPHEIYYRYHNQGGYGRSIKEDMGYEIMWKQLPNKVEPGKEVLVVRDGSGSMTVGLRGTNRGTVLDVASALTVYFSEHATGQFHNKFITFSSRPEIVNLDGCDTLADKISKLDHYDDCSNTNLEKTFMLILDTAIKNKMSQEEMPENILIISDMQFDAASHSRYSDTPKWDETLFDTIRSKFEAAGYKIPGLIFWNVNQEKTAVPEIKNELGLVLLGGYSKNNIDMICKNEFVQEVVTEQGEVKKIVKSPEQILTEKLMSERYDAIGQAIAPVLEAKRQFRPNLGEER